MNPLALRSVGEKAVWARRGGRKDRGSCSTLTQCLVLCVCLDCRRYSFADSVSGTSRPLTPVSLIAELIPVSSRCAVTGMLSNCFGLGIAGGGDGDESIWPGMQMKVRTATMQDLRNQ
ncbi:hypothetical protein CC79DRAFT_542687 [Sarocladium strictum]